MKKKFLAAVARLPLAIILLAVLSGCSDSASCRARYGDATCDILRLSMLLG